MDISGRRGRDHLHRGASMRSRARQTGRWLRWLGSTIIVVGPLVVASHLAPLSRLPHPIAFVAAFIFVGLAAQLGLIVRRWGNINIGRLLFDALLLAVTGVVAWVVVDLAIRRGGGPVDSSLLAVIMAYLLALWSGQHP